MRSPEIRLADTDNIETCPAIANGQPCRHDPRWIAENWSAEPICQLQRARSDLHLHPGSFDREQRVVRSKAIIHGQVCSHHTEHVKRLHVLNMIRGDARGGLRGPRYSAARKRRAVWAARSLTPEQGRGGGEDLTDLAMDTTLPSPDFPPTPPSTVRSASGTRATRRHRSRRSLHENATPRSRPFLATPQTTPDQGEPDITEHENENARLRRRISQLELELAESRQENSELKASGTESAREKLSLEQKLREAQDQLAEQRRTESGKDRTIQQLKARLGKIAFLADVEA